MPLDDELPLSRLPSDVQPAPIAEHFRSEFGVPVDLDGLDALPPLERQSLRSARLPEPPEAVLLDRVLQLLPAALVAPVERIVIVPTRGIARPGGSRSRIVRLSAQEARVRESDPRYGRAFSLFTTTLLHEIGHVAFSVVFTDAQREQVFSWYVDELDGLPVVPAGEPSHAGVEHFFIGLFIAAVLGRGEPPITAGVARRALAALGPEWRRP